MAVVQGYGKAGRYAEGSALETGSALQVGFGGTSSNAVGRRVGQPQGTESAVSAFGMFIGGGGARNDAEDKSDTVKRKGNYGGGSSHGELQSNGGSGGMGDTSTLATAAAVSSTTSVRVMLV